MSQGLHGTDLTLGFGRHTVIEEASIDLRPGMVTALIGPNGSGKSTVLRALARLHRPAAGAVALDDGTPADALSAGEFARAVTLLTQSRATPPGLAVRDVVAFGRHPHRRPWRGTDPDAGEAVGWALAVTGTTPMADRTVDGLSGGELQRVWLATALAQRTDVLLLDEPTNHLDLRYQVETLDLLRDLADDHDVAVGVVLHDLQHAADVADHVVLVDRGRITADGTPRQVLTAAHLSTAYGLPLAVDLDPDTGVPRPRPVPRHQRRLRSA